MAGGDPIHRATEQAKTPRREMDGFFLPILVCPLAAAFDLGAGRAGSTGGWAKIIQLVESRLVIINKDQLCVLHRRYAAMLFHCLLPSGFLLPGLLSRTTKSPKNDIIARCSRGALQACTS